MKVCLINSVLTGSTGRIARGTAERLRQRGDMPLVLYGRGERSLLENEVRFERPGEVAMHAALSRLTDRQGFYSKAATKRLLTAMEAFQPDVIQLHQPHGYYLHLPTLFDGLRGMGVPVVWTLHDCWTLTGHCAYFDMARCTRWRSGCGDCPQKTAYPASLFMDQSKRNLAQKQQVFSGVKHMTLVTPSRWLGALVESSYLGQYPVRVLHNGVNRRVFRPVESGVRAQYGVGPADRLLLGVANVWEPRKGLDALVALAAMLPEGYRLAVIGVTAEQQKTLPQGVIGIARTQNAEELAAWYTAADVYLNPTEEDNFPTTNLEALACGTPVVTFDAGGSGEMLDESCGRRLPVGAVDGLLPAVRDCLTLNRADCVKRAAAFDEEDVNDAYAALYASVTGGKRA